MRRSHCRISFANKRQARGGPARHRHQHDRHAPRQAGDTRIRCVIILKLQIPFGRHVLHVGVGIVPRKRLQKIACVLDASSYCLRPRAVKAALYSACGRQFVLRMLRAELDVKSQPRRFPESHTAHRPDRVPGWRRTARAAGPLARQRCRLLRLPRFNQQPTEPCAASAEFASCSVMARSSHCRASSVRPAR